jgi:glycine cleavage system H lipoate-binding protein
MIPHDILTLYAAKPVEYLIAVAFLLSFVPFWRVLHGGRAARRPAVVRRPAMPRLVEWFELPEPLFYHPGHAWARVEPNGVVTVGLDDFARKLVGPLAGIRLPVAGAHVGQGEPGWTLLAGDRAIDMLSPIDGIVIETNVEAFGPDRTGPDPYGEDWLLKVKPVRLSANLKSLMANGTAQKWTELAADLLRARLSSEAGLVYEDGGVPVDGIARSLDPETWDDMAREFFLTKPEP